MPEFTSDLPHHVTRQVRKSMRLEGTAGDIMLAARELYEAQGVAATSMAAIARKAGVTRSLVYYYFPDKQAVTDAVIDDYPRTWSRAYRLGTSCAPLATRPRS